MKLLSGSMAALAMSGVVCASNAAPRAAWERGYKDPWGIALTEFCDLRDRAPISEKCEGFVAGIVESTMLEGSYPEKNPDGSWKPAPGGECMNSGGIDIKAIIANIRPALRDHVGICGGGVCSSSGYVKQALSIAYPCQKAQH